MLKDVRNEFLSPAKAAADYGVVVDTATLDRRCGRPPSAGAHDIARRRGWSEVPKVQWHDPLPLAKRGGVGAHGPRTTYRVGVDIGGTFTDIVLLGSDGAVHTKKISSSVDDYARAIVDGLAELFAETGVAPGAIEEIRHGTTVASNAILEQKGARVGLITTKGFRDVLEIRTLRMPRLYDMAWTKPRAIGRALSAAGSRRAHRPQGPHRARSRSRRRRARRRRAAGREGRGHRRVPPQFVRQSGARADAARYRQAPRAGPALVGLL